MNCFIPRFDLEEDTENYYLFGELPGAKVEDIGVEVSQGNRLFVWGNTVREQVGSSKELLVNVEGQGNGSGEVKEEEAGLDMRNTEGFLPDGGFIPLNSTRSQEHRFEDGKEAGQIPEENGVAATRGRNRVLLSERLVGEFNRTFAFPSPVVEEGVQASMESGILKLVVPKQKGGGVKKTGRRVEVLKG